MIVAHTYTHLMLIDLTPYRRWSEGNAVGIGRDHGDCAYISTLPRAFILGSLGLGIYCNERRPTYGVPYDREFPL